MGKESFSQQNFSSCFGSTIVVVLFVIVVALLAFIEIPFKTTETVSGTRWKASVYQYEYRYEVVRYVWIRKVRVPRYDYVWVVARDHNIVGPKELAPMHPAVECDYVVHDPLEVGDTLCEAQPVKYQVMFDTKSGTYYADVSYEAWRLYEPGDEIKVTWRGGAVIEVSAQP